VTQGGERESHAVSRERDERDRRQRERDDRERLMCDSRRRERERDAVSRERDERERDSFKRVHSRETHDSNHSFKRDSSCLN